MNIIEEIKTRLNRYPNARYEIEDKAEPVSKRQI
jgi:hypothetical protein